MIVTECVI